MARCSVRRSSLQGALSHRLRASFQQKGSLGAPRLALLFFHGSGEPFRVEQRLLGPRVQQLLAAGVAVVLPASPHQDGRVHYWYSSDGAAVVRLLQEAKDDAPGALEALKDGEPKLLEASRGKVLEAIKALGIGPLALAGFSQGGSVKSLQ